MRAHGVRKNKEIICRYVEKKARRDKEKNRRKSEINGNYTSDKKRRNFR